MWIRRVSGLLVVSLFALVSCASAPKSGEARDQLMASAEQTLQQMKARDPSLGPLLQQAAGYAVFPSIGKGGAIVGAAYGRGILYQNGKPVGFVELNQGSLGAQLGGQTFSELIVMRNDFDVERLKTGKFSLGANISGVALTAGAAASTRFDRDIAVFVVPRGGLMAELSVGGQQINFQPLSG